MTARRPALRQRDLTRALKAAMAAGISVSRIEIDKDGKIVMLTGPPRSVAADEAELDEKMGLS